MTVLSALDAPSFQALDPQDMLGAILGLPEQVDDAKRIALTVSFEALRKRPFSSLVIAGLGGSAIGGDLLRAGFESTLRLPVTVVRDYTLPAYVGEDSLVFASSNSGNTEETLATYAAARKAKATVIAFTTGGKLAELARADGVPVVSFPGGLQPRAAVGYAFIPLIVASVGLSILPKAAIDDIDEASAIMRAVRERCKPEVPSERNEAKRLAAQWLGKIPVIYGSQGERGVAAYRWKTQINENAKALAMSNVFPELNHNETVGWSGAHGQQGPQANLSVVILRDEAEPPHIRRRVELTKQIISRHAAGLSEVWSQGSAPLARMLSLVYVGDFASYYLAIAYGEDPTPVGVIDWLKSELAKPY